MSDFNVGAIPDLALGQTSEPIPSEGQPIESPDSLLSPFLKDIPEADRPVVAPYITKWDSGVTKKFQEIHDSYKPYKDLGMDPEGLANAVEMYRLLDTEPERVLEILQEMLNVSDDNDQGQQEPVVPEFEGLPPQFVEKFNQMETVLSRFDEFINNQQAQQVEAQQVAELDTLLERMHTKHGDFDDDYVIGKLAAGYDPEASYTAYANLVEKLTAPRTSSAPSLLGGAGGIPTGQVKPQEMTPAETRDFVARALQAANNS